MALSAIAQSLLGSAARVAISKALLKGAPKLTIPTKERILKSILKPLQGIDALKGNLGTVKQLIRQTGLKFGDASFRNVQGQLARQPLSHTAKLQRLDGTQSIPLRNHLRRSDMTSGFGYEMQVAFEEPFTGDTRVQSIYVQSEIPLSREDLENKVISSIENEDFSQVKGTSNKPSITNMQITKAYRQTS